MAKADPKTPPQDNPDAGPVEPVQGGKPAFLADLHFGTPDKAKARKPKAKAKPESAPTARSFATTPDSPFADGYDMEAERVHVADLLAAENPDEMDPRWGRMVEYEDRVRRLKEMQVDYRLRHGADQLVPYPEATAMKEIGALVDEEQDAMVVHTKEAYRMFMGRGRDPNPERRAPPLIGAKRVGACLRAIWYLSGKDNPYADWALIDLGDRMDLLKKDLGQQLNRYEELLAQAKRRGLIFSVLKSKAPRQVEIGFKSPYGYGVAELVVSYDYLSRVLKTLVRKDLMSDDQGRQELRGITRRIHAMFMHVARFERYLLRPELRDLSRRDFVPGADEMAVKRVLALRELFGEVPKDVFIGAVKPRHSRRRVYLSEAELRLLEDVALAQQPANSPETAPADEADEGLL